MFTGSRKSESLITGLTKGYRVVTGLWKSDAVCSATELLCKERYCFNAFYRLNEDFILGVAVISKCTTLHITHYSHFNILVWVVVVVNR